MKRIAASCLISFSAISFVAQAVPVAFDYEMVTMISPGQPGSATYYDFSINDSGDVSYITQEPVLGSPFGSPIVVNRNTVARIQNGSTTILHTDQSYEPGPYLDGGYFDLTMNNLGDVGFRLRFRSSGNRILVESKSGAGAATKVADIYQLMTHKTVLNDNGEYAYGNRNFGGIGRIAPERTGLPTGDFAVGSNINNNGYVAVSSRDFSNGSDYIDVFRFPDPDQPRTFDQASITVSSDSLSTVSLNDLNAVAFSERNGSGTFDLKFAQPFQGNGVFNVTDLAGTSITSDARELGLNNLNSILFRGRDTSDPQSVGGYYMVSSDGSNLRQVVSQADRSLFDIGNLRAGNIDSAGGSALIDDERLNNKDEAIFSVSYSDGSSALWKAKPKIGTSAANPILPDPDSQNADGSWDINLGRCQSLLPCYFDPEYATGYEYVLSDPNAAFASVIIPTSLGGGDSIFEVIFGGFSETLYAGQTFDFTSYLIEGVSEFSILGIDIEEMLDPDDPSAFVTGVSLLGDWTEDLSVNMKPLTTFVGPTKVPEPSSLGLIFLGVFGLAIRRIKASGFQVPNFRYWKRGVLSVVWDIR